MINFSKIVPLFLTISLGIPAVSAPVEGGKNLAVSRIDCGRATSKDEWLTIRYEDAIEKLGKPITEEEFILSTNALPEFRLGLRKYQRSLKSGGNFTVREVTWPVSDCRLTLWFKTNNAGMRAISTLYWNKNLEF